MSCNFEQIIYLYEGMSYSLRITTLFIVSVCDPQSSENSFHVFCNFKK